jgi:molecular chaperone DnaJ
MVNIPAGVEDGSQIRLRGEGEAGIWGGVAGNLYVAITTQEHELFKREGNDIIYELPINFAQAALGDEVEIITLDGKMGIKISPGIQTGEILRLRGKGIPYLYRPGRGDQLVKIRVVTPDRLNEEQRQLFQKLAQSLDETDTSVQKEKRLFKRIKKGLKEH